MKLEQLKSRETNWSENGLVWRNNFTAAISPILPKLPLSVVIRLPSPLSSSCLFERSCTSPCITQPPLYFAGASNDRLSILVRLPSGMNGTLWQFVCQAGVEVLCSIRSSLFRPWNCRVNIVRAIERIPVFLVCVSPTPGTGPEN